MTITREENAQRPAQQTKPPIVTTATVWKNV